MEETEENTEMKQTWRKIEHVSKKAGLREGISSGRESNFQENFDIGYREGFKNGYALGKYKGSVVACSKQHSSEAVNYSVPEKVRWANCLLCKDEQLLKSDLSEIIRKQTELSEKNLKELYLKFNPS